MLHKAIIERTSTATTLAEIIGAFSYALDLTEGQPAGHCVRSCIIGTRIGERLGLGSLERRDLFYTLLLKDLGCSSNAARIAELYLTDDRSFKHDYKTIPTGLRSTLGFVFSHTGRGETLAKRFSAIGNILKNGDGIAQEMILARCTRGSEIARKLHFSERVCRAIYHLDEHWDGSGRPDRLRGEAIPLFSRIALLAQIVDVFRHSAGREAAMAEVRARAGTWLDPQLVAVFETMARDEGFWRLLASPRVDRHLLYIAPSEDALPIEEDYLDDITHAFGQVIDAKSPFTSGHSERVADYAVAVAERMGVLPARRRWLRRAAALHDVGKLGVSNAILDKPAKLESEEWAAMRAHALHTHSILERLPAIADIAPVAAAHHERLDGTGYPFGLDQRTISRETRIITVCDFFDALTADRPYRAALTTEEALDIMRCDVGKAIDGDCFDALRAAVA